MIFLKIKNLEKKKLFFKYKFKSKKNIKFFLIDAGCYLTKFIFFFTKRIKKNEIVIKSKKNIILNKKNYIFFKYSFIKYKKKIKLKNKKILKTCDCNLSFKI